MERRLHFEGMISYNLFLKQTNWKNIMPMLHKNCKENEFTGLIQHLNGMDQATVSIKIFLLSSLWFSLLINT